MPYSFPEIKKFRGLYLQANSFDVPDGALEEADNVVIAKDGIVSKMRGRYLYLAGGADNLRSLFMYGGSLFAAYQYKIARLDDTGTDPNKTGSPTVLTGPSVSIAAGKVARTLEQNQNLYLTTDSGVLKLESPTGNLLKTGVPPALDLRGYLLAENGGVKGDAQTMWRVVFGRRDERNALYLGAPSDILLLTNSVVSGASWSKSGGGPYTVTVSSSGHNLETGMVIVIEIWGAESEFEQTVTKIDANSFSWSQIADPGGPGTINYWTDRAANVEFSVPSEIDATDLGWFYQVYRSSASNSEAASPLPDFKLTDEQKLTAGEISSGVVLYHDITNDLFRGAELYTNPGSREGEDQANGRSPLCQDVCFFKNYAIYANTISRHLLELNIITASTAFINEDDYIEVKLGATTRRYVARLGIGNDVVTGTAAGTGTITITYNSHGLRNGDSIYVLEAVGTLLPGEYTVSNKTPNTFDISVAGKTASRVTFEGLADSSGYFIFQLYYTGASVAVSLRETASGLVKAINSDSASLIYANYTSNPVAGGVSSIPGRMLFEAKLFGGAFSVRAYTATANPIGQAFSPELPASFGSGTQVTSSNDAMPNALYVSKLGEPEAVPWVNYFPVGSKQAEIMRVVALRDSIICIKADGVWIVNGDSILNFFATPLDKTAVCVAPNSIDVINNQAVGLFNQGVCLCSNTAVRIVSRDIEIPIRAVLGSPVIAAQTVGAAYESERLYYLTTILPGSTSADVTWVYNTLSDGWSTCDMLMLHGTVGTAERFHFISRLNNLYRERKFFDRTDFCGQNYSTTVVSVASDYKSALISSPAVSIEIGDVLIKSETISRIKTVTLAAAGLFAVTFHGQSNVRPTDNPVLYKRLVSKIKLSPFHAGAVGRMKQFSQTQFHLRDNSVSDLLISYTTQAFGGSASVNWTFEQAFGSGGWGNEPWGFFQWGQQDVIASKYSTQPAPIIRTYVPLHAQRCTFIQPYIEHSSAGEEINLQAITFAVRGYRERDTR